jgi:hypothetical protein
MRIDLLRKALGGICLGVVKYRPAIQRAPYALVSNPESN